MPYIWVDGFGIGPWIFGALSYTNATPNLAKIVILGGTTIPKDAFAYLTTVETIEIYGDDISIAQYAFRNCMSLKTLKIYAKVSYISEFAFYGLILDELYYIESEEVFKALFPKGEGGKIKYYPSPKNYYVISE